MFSVPTRRSQLPFLTFLLITVSLFVYYSFDLFSRSGYRTSHRRSTHKIQYNFPRGERAKSLAQEDRLYAVKKEFLHAWTSYVDHGEWADELGPLTGRKDNKFCGWSATLVDALDTLWIMDLKDEFQNAVVATSNIEFSIGETNCVVNLFETTIRHLGGLISAYDLSQEEAFIPKMRELGDVLLSAFNTHKGLPCSLCVLKSQPDTQFQPSSNIAMAAQGTLHLEFTRLTQILKDDKYFLAVMNITEALARIQMLTSIPGSFNLSTSWFQH